MCVICGCISRLLRLLRALGLLDLLVSALEFVIDVYESLILPLDLDLTEWIGQQGWCFGCLPNLHLCGFLVLWSSRSLTACLRLALSDSVGEIHVCVWLKELIAFVLGYIASDL